MVSLITLKQNTYVSMSVLCIHALTLRYSDIPLEDIQRSCPACCGTCNCRVCLRRDNLVKVILIKESSTSYIIKVKFLLVRSAYW